MAEVLSEGHHHEHSEGSNAVLAVVLILIVLAFLLFFGLPVLRNLGTGTQAPSVNVPPRVDINVNQPEQPAP